MSGNLPPSGGMQTTPQAAKGSLVNSGGGQNDVMLTPSADSRAMLDYWDQTDTIVDGIKAMRDAGDKYLPKFTDEQGDDYAFRVRLTKLTNVYRDIVEALSSKPFEQEVTLETDESKTVPQPITDFSEDVDGAGNSITIFSGATFFNGINSAIDWIFVDYPPVDPTIRSQADAKASGARPYWSHVLGRNVLDSQSQMISGKETLVYLRIYEPGTIDHIRIFQRDPISGVVSWQVFVKGQAWVDAPHPFNGKTQFVLDSEGVVTIGVIPLVPFFTGRRDGRSWRFFPAMRDAADLQIELYQQESGLKFAKVLAAYPMLAGNGVKPPMQADGKTPKKLAVGPGRVLYAPPDGAGVAGSWEYVEPSATSLTFLANDVKETIAQLRELGRQPLSLPNDTVVSATRNANKSKSAVKAWALLLKDALENAMVITCQWMNIDPATYDPTVNVYTEFDDFMNGGDLVALAGDRTRKDISRVTYWEEMKRRGVYSAEFTAQREEERLLKEMPSDGPDTDPTIDPKTGLPIVAPPVIDPKTGLPIVKPPINPEINRNE